MILGDKAQALFALPEWTRLTEALRPKIVDVRAVGQDIRVTARIGS
jgi:riboflavin biosynthesis pyrimidine reductase